MAKERRTFTAEEKVAIVRRHLLEGVAVSDLCDEHGLNPTVLYRWQRALFENGAAAFERRSDARERELEQQVAALGAKLGLPGRARTSARRGPSGAQTPARGGHESDGAPTGSSLTMREEVRILSVSRWKRTRAPRESAPPGIAGRVKGHPSGGARRDGRSPPHASPSGACSEPPCLRKSGSGRSPSTS